MNKKLLTFLSFVVLLLGSLIFLLIFSPAKVFADHCDSCQSTQTQWCYDEVIGDWVECGHYCSGNPCPPAQICTPNDRCNFYDYGSNFCCNSVPISQTTSDRKGNNVCNYEYWMYCNSTGTACDQGPYAYTLNSVTHGCTSLLSCGICSAGQTQTETRFNTNCATSTCGGNTCAREVTRQERTLTCNSDCGGWSVTQDWHDVQSYPECPANNECGTSSQSGSSCYAPPGHVHTYSCVNNSCTHTDTPGGSTDSNCGGTCSAPPTPQRYACSGGACVVNANGPYTVSNCNNSCSSGASCNVSWSSFNSNPPPNQIMQVKVLGVSSNRGWPDVRLYVDDAEVGSWGGIENPWPTFIWNNVPTKGGGIHTLSYGIQSGATRCTPIQTFTTQFPPPVCTNTTPGVNQLTGCLWDGVSFNTSDGNAPPGLSSDSINNPLIPPVGDTAYSATALNQDWGSGGPNAFVGSDTFSARWRGNFDFKNGKYTFKIGSDDGVRLWVDGNQVTLKDSSGNTNSWIDQSWGSTDKWKGDITFTAFKSNVPVILEYYENGGNAQITLSWQFTPPVVIGPWIQIDGDVHTNGRIRVPPPP